MNDSDTWNVDGILTKSHWFLFQFDLKVMIFTYRFYWECFWNIYVNLATFAFFASVLNMRRFKFWGNNTWLSSLTLLLLFHLTNSWQLTPKIWLINGCNTACFFVLIFVSWFSSLLNHPFVTAHVSFEDKCSVCAPLSYSKFSPNIIFAIFCRCQAFYLRWTNVMYFILAD